MEQPRWLEAAWRELGEYERPGATHNPRILAMFREVGHPNVHEDETAWCAAFAGACLERSGVLSTRSLRARSYLAWGQPLESSNGRLGAVAVLSRGTNPALGHVGFLVGETAERMVLLGGNQSNSVSVAAYDKSRLLGLRWPIVGLDAGLGSTAIDNGDSAFAFALKHVLEMEGGWSDDPYDPGGPTNKGITLKVYATHRGITLDAASRPRLISELRAIPDALVATIYRQRYWQPAQCAWLPLPVALMHFDAAVNHGVGAAIRFLQQALGVESDGIIGPLTRRAIAETRPAKVIAHYAELRIARYRSLPHFWRFGRGWLGRVEATRSAAQRLLATGGAPSVVQSQTFSPNRTGAYDMTTRSKDTDLPTPVASKWWGHSLTIWGAIVTALAAILPVVGPVIGVDVSAELVRQIGGQMGAVLQALAGLIGTAMTIYGRVRATASLTRRSVQIRL